MNVIYNALLPFSGLEILIFSVVLLAAAYQVLETIYHQIRIASRRRTLHLLQSEGHALQAGSPSSDAQQMKLALDGWIKKTSSTLNAYSPNATEYFEQVNSPAGAGSPFEALLVRLDNLKAIIERPDLYYY